MFKSIYIEITNSCNLNCSFCLKNTRTPRMLTRDQFNHILDQVYPHTDHVYLHVQGEPFMHPELINFLDDCHYRHLKVHLVTNGTLLSKVSPDLYKHPALVQLSISLHSAQMIKDDSNYIVLKELIRTIEMNHLSLFLRLWTFKDQSINELLYDLIDNDSISLSGKRIRVKKNLFIDLDQEFFWPNLSNPFISETGTCHSGTLMLAILSNGEISPCCLDSDGTLSIGNIFNENLDDCLKKPRFINIVNGFRQRKCVEDLCQKCSYRIRFNK